MLDRNSSKTSSSTEKIADWDLFFCQSGGIIKLYTDVAITINETKGDVESWEYSLDGITFANPASPVLEAIAAGVFYIKATFSTATAILIVKAVKQ